MPVPLPPNCLYKQYFIDAILCCALRLQHLHNSEYSLYVYVQLFGYTIPNSDLLRSTVSNIMVLCQVKLDYVSTLGFLMMIFNVNDKSMTNQNRLKIDSNQNRKSPSAD